MAVVISLALMVMDHRLHHLKNVRSALSVALYPLHFIVDLPLSATRWLSETLATRNRLQEDNQRLQKEILLLQVEQQKLTALEAENRRLRDLLEMEDDEGPYRPEIEDISLEESLNEALERLSERERAVLYSVMFVDLQVALAAELQCEPAVFRKLFEHVIEETNARADLGLTGRVQVDAGRYARLVRISFDVCDAVRMTQ